MHSATTIPRTELGGVMAASSLNDYAEPADEKQIMDVYAGNARVQR